jgi:hypothetical protein
VRARTIILDIVNHLEFLHVSETGCISVIRCKNGKQSHSAAPIRKSLSQSLDHYSVPGMDNVKK